MDNFPETEAGNAFYQSSHESLNLNSISLADLPRQGPALREGRQCNNNRNMALYSFLEIWKRINHETRITSRHCVVLRNSRQVSCVNKFTSFVTERRSMCFGMRIVYTTLGNQNCGICLCPLDRIFTLRNSSQR